MNSKEIPVSDKVLVVKVNALVQRGDDQDNVTEHVTVPAGMTVGTAVHLQLGSTKGYSVVSVREQTPHEASWAEFE